MKKPYIFGIITILLMILSYLPLFTFNYKTVRMLIKEDGIYENLQAIFYFLSSILMFFLFFRSKLEKSNIFFFLLGLMFLIFLGEEISWGQRIFDLKTPQLLSKINSQNEVSIHNLWVLENYDKSNHLKTGWMRWMNADRLLAISWMVFCVAIPILNAIPGKIQKTIQKVKLPIVPIWIGFLFVSSFIISKSAEFFWTNSDHQPVSEVKETCFAYLYLLVTASIYVSETKFLKILRFIYHKSNDEIVPHAQASQESF